MEADTERIEKLLFSLIRLMYTKNGGMTAVFPHSLYVNEGLSMPILKQKTRAMEMSIQ